MDIRKNVGKADRVVRFVFATVLTGLLVTHTIAAGVRELLGWVAVVVLLITALDETCPAYLLFGINTRKKENA
jgi:hypothetical protein